MIYINSKRVVGVSKGNTSFSKIYKGTDLVFQKNRRFYGANEFVYKTTKVDVGINTEFLQIPNNPIKDHYFTGNEWIVRYENDVTELPNGFCSHTAGLSFPTYLKEIIHIPKTIKKIGNRCFYNCPYLVYAYVYLPELLIMGSNCFAGMEKCDAFYFTAPKLKEIKGLFLTGTICEKLTLDLPELIHIGDYFLIDNINLKTLNLNIPNVEDIGDGFLEGCEKLTSFRLTLNNLTTIGNRFLANCKNIISVSLNFPNLLSIDGSFCYNTKLLTGTIDAPLLQTIGSSFCAVSETNSSTRVFYITFKFNSIESIYGKEMFRGVKFDEKNSEIYVPSEKLNWFKENVPNLADIFIPY